MYYLGDALCDLKRYADSEVVYRKATELAPKDGDLQRGLALALEGQGRAAEAEKAYRRAISLDDNDPRAHDYLGTMLRDIEDGRQLSEAMRRHPQVVNPIFTSMVRAGETGGSRERWAR